MGNRNRPTATLEESEKAFQGWVMDTARALGWSVWHIHDSRREVAPGRHVGDTDAAGLPDLVLIHRDPPRMLLVEVKDRDGAVRPSQKAFLDAARVVEAEIADAWEGSQPPRPFRVFVWRPEHRPFIEAVLRGGNL